jgi:hypothetical protein
MDVAHAKLIKTTVGTKTYHACVGGEIMHTITVNKAPKEMPRVRTNRNIPALRICSHLANLSSCFLSICSICLTVSSPALYWFPVGWEIPGKVYKTTGHLIYCPRNDPRICQRTVGEDSLAGYGPVTSANRPVRTRMPGGVARGGEKPPLTRLGISVIMI